MRVLTVLLPLGVVGCLNSGAPELHVVADPGQPELVRLHQGQTATFGPTRLTFTSLTQDSRCPVDAVCVWQGEARLDLTVGPVDGGAGDVLLHLSTLETTRRDTLWGTQIHLSGVLPDAKAGVSIAPEDYIAVLELTVLAGGGS